MENLYNKIKLYLGRDFTTWESDDGTAAEVKITNDGSGDYISSWTISSEKSQPTEEQLNAVSVEADTLLATNKAISKRKMEYPDWHEFAEAYTEKEIDGNSTKWNAYIINRNKVRSDNPK